MPSYHSRDYNELSVACIAGQKGQLEVVCKRVEPLQQRMMSWLETGGGRDGIRVVSASLMYLGYEATLPPAKVPESAAI